MRVSISRALLEQIVAMAAAETIEICGLLLGEEGSIRAIRPAANISADAERHFELDPAVLLSSYRAARSGGARVLGHYHSHPSGSAVPSTTDRASAVPDGRLWLIAGRHEVRLWIATADKSGGVWFQEAMLDIM